MNEKLVGEKEDMEGSNAFAATLSFEMEEVDLWPGMNVEPVLCLAW